MKGDRPDNGPTIEITPAPNKGRWPAEPAVVGEAYGAEDPNWPGTQIVVMAYETFVNYGTYIEELRRTSVQQDARIRELLSEAAMRDLRVQEAETRLDNLREVRRSEKRAEVEKGLIMPGDSRFNSGKGK